MTKAKNITVKRLREVLRYDPCSGNFTWRIARKKCTVGAVAGFYEPSRYVKIRIDYAQHYAHRLAWLYMTGHWPRDQIDHINQHKDDNRWANLRECSQKQNSENMKRSPRSASGIAGVYWHNRDSLWVARIKHHRRQITLGYFKSKQHAAACRRDAELRLFTHSPLSSKRP